MEGGQRENTLHLNTLKVHKQTPKCHTLCPFVQHTCITLLKWHQSLNQAAQRGCVLKALLFQLAETRWNCRGNTLVHTEPQFHRQDGLGSCLGGRMERIQSLPWKQLVPAWHHLVVRENSSPSNPGATLASPSHHLSRVKAPVQLHTPHSHWHNRFPHQL